ncbi:MAG: sigma-70 family RNA polymerase sigma factor [Bacteroidales bacterium]|nr:sigma-70 family RNA polymerase sigma factor [Bacteroidales bacterium]
MHSIDDNTIISEVLKGDKDAFGQIVTRYEKPVFNLMYRTTGSTEEAADLAQETFIKAYNKIWLFKTDKKFFPWLYAIGINLARDYLRRKKPENYSLDDDNKNANFDKHQSAYVHDPADNLDMQKLFQALARLPLDYREAIILRYREDLSTKEIAEILHLSVSGVKMRVHRGLDKLRELISGKNKNG